MALIEEGRLRQWEQELSAEVETLRQRSNQIQSELQRSMRKLELVRQMLEVDGQDVQADQQRGPDGTGPRPTSITVRDCVRRILQEAGKPLHISEIHQEFLRRGYPIPGVGTAFNILAHIVKNKDFVRLARGTYALSESVPADKVVVARSAERRRRSRRRRASPASRVPKEQLSA